MILVERKTGLVLIGCFNERTAFEARDMIIKLLTPFKKTVKSITFDNGAEFNYHHAIEHYLNTTVYFAEHYKSWQRGTNENTNGLIRQFIPKPAAISLVDDEQIKKIEYLLNSRPRKRHKFKKPASFYSKKLRRIAFYGVI